MAATRRRIVVWGTCDTGKPRVRILLEGLRRNGVEVVECRAAVWRGVDDKSQVGRWRWLALLARMLLSYPLLVLRYLRLPPHDAVLLGYPAIPDVFVIKPFAALRRTPVAMDWFLSAYDTVVQDRRLVGPRHPLAWLLWCVEALAARSADRLFMDTRAHARRMEALFRLAPGSCGSVWVGVEADAFASDTAVRRGRHGALQVLFYGQFIPLHGIGVILDAARRTRDQAIDWLLIGRGQEAALAQRMLDASPLPRLRWLEWAPYDELRSQIRASDVCLGIFGTSDKAASVIPNKVFQALAAGTPVITRDSEAIRELVPLAGGALRLVAAGDGAALADALRSPPGPQSAEDHRRLLAAIDEHAIGRQLLAALALEDAAA